MDRSALLLYLQNVRDLEVAKYKLEQMFRTEKRAMEDRKRELPTSIRVSGMRTPENYRFPIGLLFCWVLLKVFAVFFVINKPVLIGIIFYLFGILFFCLIVSSVVDHRNEIKECKKANERAMTERQSAQIQVRNNAAEIKKIDANWQKKNAWYNQECGKVERLLRQFYSMNILPAQYRNLAAVCYIYDYMSTSRASFEETLIHEHMENGIQRLEQKLDEVIYRIEDLVYETRCMRAENRQAVDRMISQNDHMLTHLRQIETNSENAAMYAQLASNYSKANAYFSMANYLSRR